MRPRPRLHVYLLIDIVPLAPPSLYVEYQNGDVVVTWLPPVSDLDLVVEYKVFYRSERDEHYSSVSL